MATTQRHDRAEELRAALRCGNPGCSCHRENGNLLHCPTHVDPNPSLSVKQDGDRLLVHCHAGCSQESVLAALRDRGLWPGEPERKNGHEPPKLVATYGYRDHQGRDAAEKGRFESPAGKSFRWRRPGSEKWDGLGGLRIADLSLWGSELVPKRPNEPVFFVEGEKACLACRERGLLAVTFGGGAGSTDFGRSLEALAGRDVILWPDNDEPGRSYMARVQAALRPIARSIAMVSPPVPNEGDDAFEYFAHGGTVEALRLVDSIPPSRVSPAPRCAAFSADELINIEFTEEPTLVPGMISVGLTILAGRPKLGKSWLALQLALAVGMGGRFLGRECAKGRVAYFAFEDSPRRMQRRMKALGWPKGAGVVFFFGWGECGSLENLPALIEAKGFDLVVLDTLSRALPTGTKRRDSGDMSEVLAPVQEAAMQGGRAVLALDHYRKPAVAEAGDFLDEVMDSTAKVGVADTIIGLARKRGERGATLKISGRDFADDAELAIEHDRDTGCWQLIGDAAEVRQSERKRKVMEAVRALVGEGQAVTPTSVSKAADMPLPHTSALLSQLAEDGWLVRLAREGKSQPYGLPMERGMPRQSPYPSCLEGTGEPELYDGEIPNGETF